MKAKLASFSLLSRLGKDIRGTVLVQFTVYLVAIMGMIGLSLDGARLILVKNGLQDLADAAALAGAAQLDGAQDALTRATTAANSLTNTPRWYNVAGTAIQSVQFCSSFSGNSCTTTTDPTNASYIKITTGSWQVAPSFLVAVGSGSSSTSASAVAQGLNSSGASNCAPTQSLICNPYEATETNAGNANNFVQNVSVGTMIHLVNGAGAAGNWGLVDPPPPLTTNPHDQAPFWAETSVGSACVPAGQPNTRTGNVPKFAQGGMNVRFDSPAAAGDESVSAPVVIDGFYPAGGSGGSHLGGFNCEHFGNGYNGGTAGTISPVSGSGANPVYPSGFDPSNYSATCNASTPIPTPANCTPANSSNSTNPTCVSCPLPRDRTFTKNIGNGPNLTDLQAYWRNHHSGSLPSGVTSRYQIYQGEASGSYAFISDAAEPHAPLCTNSTVGNASRRVINVAVVDCSYWGITGKKPLPPTNLLAQFFMTEPALDDGSIYGEYIGCFTNDPAADPSGKCVTSASAGNQSFPLPRASVQLVK